jgi:phage baseplate assembly protein gpV
MLEALLGLEERVRALELWIQRLIRWGVVEDVDAIAQTVKVRLPSGLVVGPMPWVAAGTALFVAPTTGEQCLVLSPPGDGARQAALCGIGRRGDGKGDRHVIGSGETYPVALAPKVEEQLHQILEALMQVSAGGGSFTGPSSYTTVGSVAATKTEAE